MKKTLLVAILTTLAALTTWTSLEAAKGGYVRPYRRKDGTYVQGHYRGGSSGSTYSSPSTTTAPATQVTPATVEEPPPQPEPVAEPVAPSPPPPVAAVSEAPPPPPRPKSVIIIPPLPENHPVIVERRTYWRNRGLRNVLKISAGSAREFDQRAEAELLLEQEIVRLQQRRQYWYSRGWNVYHPKLRGLNSKTLDSVLSASESYRLPPPKPKPTGVQTVAPVALPPK